MTTLHPFCETSPRAARRRKGQMAHLSGQSAEDSVARHYAGLGVVETARRWRGQGGEIDLVLADGDVIVFCEVKKARNFDTALAALGEAQIQRILAAASEYLATCPRGQLSDVRFDLALVGGSGAVHLMENAFGHF